MPESWVILIFVELFWPKCLSYFAENAWVIFQQEFWVILVRILEFFWVRTLSKTCKMQKYPQINQKFARNSNVLSYIPNHLPKICRPLELFPPSAWVIFKTLSYFAWEILELFSKRRKKKPAIMIMLYWDTKMWDLFALDSVLGWCALCS